MTAAAPLTIPECDKLLVRTHTKYLRAMGRNELADAAELWIQLHELLDLRIHLPQQRPPSA